MVEKLSDNAGVLADFVFQCWKFYNKPIKQKTQESSKKEASGLPDPL